MAAMLERLEFRERACESVNLELPRMPRAMKPSEFLLGTILAVDVGFSQFPGMLPGIFVCSGAEYLRVFFVVVALRQLAWRIARLRERAWATAKLWVKELTLDTDATVHTV
ncbi:MAG: hypothetical protein INH43_12955 [Acidobacteriaceae bacterium]|nr:hypothetical protein [Acidobacteriaceae bacterium]